jgi:hypothetical protein
VTPRPVTATAHCARTARHARLRAVRLPLLWKMVFDSILVAAAVAVVSQRAVPPLPSSAPDWVRACCRFIFCSLAAILRCVFFHLLALIILFILFLMLTNVTSHCWAFDARHRPSSRELLVFLNGVTLQVPALSRHSSIHSNNGFAIVSEHL